MRPVWLVGGLGLAAFAGILIVLRNPIVELIYGSEYVSFTSAIFLVALLPFVIFQKSMLTKGLQAFQNTRPIFLGTIAGATIGSIVGGMLIYLFGLPFAGIVMVLTNVVSISWLAWVWNRYLSGQIPQSAQIEREAELLSPR